MLPLTVAGRQAEGEANLRELLAWVGLSGQADQLPPELAAIPAIKPGSRGIQGVK